MRTLKNLGQILKFKHYASESLVFVLSHPDEEPNNHKIYYGYIEAGGVEKWQDWKHFDIDSEVIDFCYGVHAELLFVARKG